MDPKRFDQLARLIGAGKTRRGLLKTLTRKRAWRHRCDGWPSRNRSRGENAGSGGRLLEGRRLRFPVLPAQRSHRPPLLRRMRPVVAVGPPAVNECYTAGICQPGSGSCSPTIYHGAQTGASCSTGVCHNNVCCTLEDPAVRCAPAVSAARKPTIAGNRSNACWSTVRRAG